MNSGQGIPGYLYAAVPLMAAGIGAFIWIGRRPDKKNAAVQKSTHMVATGGSAWTVNTSQANARENLPMLNTSRLFRNNPDYRHDIEDLNYDSIMNGYSEIAVLNRVDRLAKKYSVDQLTIFQDIRITRYRRY